ncbi:hypothetical protein DL93DRAFT_1796751 [Clavulina sp. PMI_390]|nr:hypothetical protein DL93DRAFT_1796751 [Clavulina sp. PMI_390]
MLDRGAACLRCRKHKVKCNGLKPYCGRCHKLHEECVYPSGVARRRRASDTLEARVLELELVTLKLTLLSTHNLFLASARLLERIGRLGNLAQPISSLRLAKSTLQLVHPGGKNSEAEGRRSKGLGEDTSTTDLSAIQKIVEKQLCSYSPTEIEGLEELPLSLSLHLIELFLPSHAVYYFLVDVPHFVRRVSLPSSHPDSIHPCLLNVCYLAACTNQGGELTQFKPLFLRRTRRFLQQSLMFADRITHFLWANVVLSVFFAKERRLLESITTASAATHFAVACGLSLPGSPVSQHNNSITNDNLLPSPIDADEADDRVRLSHAIYLGIQAFPQLCGYPPTFPFEDCWSPISQEASLRLQDGKVCSVPSYYSIC